MPSLEPPDSYTLSGACGWLELGNVGEAEAELGRLSKTARSHPDALEILWLIQSRKEDWDAAARTAEELRRRAPERASGWLHFPYALRRSNRGDLRVCWEALLPAAEKFPDEPVIPYNLACYACQLDRLDDAREWFAKALKIEERLALKTVSKLMENLGQEVGRTGGSGIKKMALKDDDLKPLWEEIERL